MNLITHAIERSIAHEAVSALLDAGCSIKVSDDEGVILVDSRDKAEILTAMWASPENHLHVSKDNRPIGTVDLRWGRGSDCMSHYSMPLHDVLKPATALQRKLDTDL